MSAINELFKRLLCAVAFVKGVEPTPKAVFDVLEEQSKAMGLGPRDFHQSVPKWLRHTPPNEGSRKVLLQLINPILFETDEKKYIKNIAIRFEELDLQEELKERVETYIGERKAGTQRTSHIPIFRDFTRINPLDIQGQVRNGVLKAHLLYHSYPAAELWQEVAAHPDYPLYDLCSDGLSEVLRSDEWKSLSEGAEIIFVLGAGGVTKDEKILDTLKRDDFNGNFVWVEASLPMLDVTLKSFRQGDYRNIRLRGLGTDFELPARMAWFYEESIPEGPGFDSKKVFFILGFTLSNIREDNFFLEYAKYCSEGDLFVFPMQFIPDDVVDDSTARSDFESLLKSCYAFDKGKELSKAGLGNVRNQKVARFNSEEVVEERLGKSTRSLCIRFSVELQEEHHPGMPPMKVVTAESRRHRRDDFEAFISEWGFEIVGESKPQVRQMRVDKRSMKVFEEKFLPVEVITLLVRFNGKPEK